MNLFAMKTRTRCLALTLLLGTLALDSQAQFGGGMGGGRRGKSMDSQTGTADANRALPSLDQISNQLLDLRMRLLITPEQSPPWEVFYARYIDFASTRPALASDYAEPSALQLMQRQLALAQSRFTLTENLVEATKNLYAQLTPEQQRIVDQQLPKLLTFTPTGTGPRAWTPAASR